MTPIQIMALIVAIFGGIKIIVLLMNPKSWLSFVKTIYKNPGITTIIALIVAGASLWYLLKYMTIVHIFAAMLFTMALILLGFVAYPKDTLAFAEKMLKDKNLLRKCWLVTIIWIVLLAWVIYSIFFI